MQRLIHNPIFRIIGAAIILYYGLFHNKYYPDSLGNRLAPDKIKNNLEEISSKGVNIITTVRKVEDIKKSLDNQPTKDRKQPVEQQDGQ